MGCDIHLHFERKNREGQWEKLEIPDEMIPSDRNYNVFGFLADVRGDGEQAQFPFRGLPENTTAIQGELGHHSYTYAYLDEIYNAPWKEAELNDSYFYVFCVYVLPRLHGYLGYITDEEKRAIRVVMGFDS